MIYSQSPSGLKRRILQFCYIMSSHSRGIIKMAFCNLSAVNAAWKDIGKTLWEKSEFL